MRKWIKMLAVVMTTALVTWNLPGRPKKDEAIPGIHESRHIMPFPLQKGGEKIDVLVRVRDSDRAYQFNLLMAELDEWPEEKKLQLRRFYDGLLRGGAEETPYPVRLRIRIDSLDESQGMHIDKVVSDRSVLYGRSMESGAGTWRAQRVHFDIFPPGVYRLRVDNLAPVTQFDFETFFIFERDNRKY